VRVITAEREHLIRMSLRELLPRLIHSASGKCTAARWCGRVDRQRAAPRIGQGDADLRERPSI
jgi:hypothetical protein